MTTYTLFGQTGSGTIDGATEVLTNGLQFSVSSPVSLTGFWFYSAAGAGQLPTRLALFDHTGTEVAGTDDTSPAWSGAAGSGWVKYTFASPVTLDTGVTYTAAVSNSPTGGQTWYPITSGFWTSFPSGITNGPLSCPTQPNTFDDFTWGFPNGAFGNFNIWLDVEVSSGSAHTVGAALTVTPSFAAAPAPRARGAALQVIPSFAAARAAAYIRGAALTVIPSFAARPSGGVPRGSTPYPYHHRGSHR